MGVVSRIIEYIDSKGVTKYKFYKETGLSNGCLDKGENLGSDKCERIISHYPDINPTWLITGKGEMLQNISNLAHEAVIKQPDISEPSLLYKLFKEKDTEVGLLKEEIGRLKAETEGLEEEVTYWRTQVHEEQKTAKKSSSVASEKTA